MGEAGGIQSVGIRSLSQWPGTLSGREDCVQWRWNVALVWALALSAVQGRAEIEMGIQAVAAVVSVYDGDTFRVEADIWPGLVWLGSVRG